VPSMYMKLLGSAVASSYNSLKRSFVTSAEFS
jgi:hypothetical protein